MQHNIKYKEKQLDTVSVDVLTLGELMPGILEVRARMEREKSSNVTIKKLW